MFFRKKRKKHQFTKKTHFFTQPWFVLHLLSNVHTLAFSRVPLEMTDFAEQVMLRDDAIGLCRNFQVAPEGIVTFSPSFQFKVTQVNCIKQQ